METEVPGGHLDQEHLLPHLPYTVTNLIEDCVKEGRREDCVAKEILKATVCGLYLKEKIVKSQT